MTQGPSPFAGITPVASLAHADGAVTLVEGTTFALSGRAGDMHADFPHGLFVLDTRVVSVLELHVNHHRLEPLTVQVDEPFAATFVSRSAPAAGRADADIIVFRRRHIGRGMREEIRITNHGVERVPVAVEVLVDVDFADLFEVKESRVRPRGHRRRHVTDLGLEFEHDDGRLTKQVHIAVSPEAALDPGQLHWQITLEPGGTWEVCLEVSVRLAEHEIEPRFRCGGDDSGALPSRRLNEWRARLPIIDTDHAGLARILDRSASDLGALRIFDPDHPEVPILAAGAPWFMTVFGRDSLLTSWMTLIADPSLAHGVLTTLARFQGEDVNRQTEEEPGKILHEMRFGAAGGLSLGGGDIYYGTADATPLFVMLLGELRRWDPADVFVQDLLPHADRALDWIRDYGDRDGDGYVEYQRATEAGLANQGWKDSWDAIRFADGTLAEPPIALAEVQGYVYAAYVARAHFAREAGDEVTYQRWATRARELRHRFNEDFWLDHEGTFALALDRDKRPVDAVASNVGHCLWTGIVDPERAGSVADRLLASDMFSGFGVRTLSSDMVAYNPVSYHNGSVWPHDNAICAAGLSRYGYTEHSSRVIAAQLDMAVASGGSLPELFAGFDRAHLGVPASYPTSCSPQAWAAASPLLWLRTMLRLDPWLPHGVVWVDPHLPPSISRIEVAGIRLGGRPVTVHADGGEVEVQGQGDLEVRHEPRPALTAAFDPRI